MKHVKKKVLLSIPEALVRQLDELATKQNRSRSAEVCVRLEKSIKGGRAKKVVGEK